MKKMTAMQTSKISGLAAIRSARFYAILDTSYIAPANCYRVCQQLLDAGAPIIQLRAKKQTDSERESIIKKILPLFKHSDTPLIINDDIALAQKYPQLGLHIGQDDCPIEEARNRLGESAIIGLSTHSIEQAQAAIEKQRLIDYFAVGPVFATLTKPDYSPVGLELVNQVAKLNPPLPWFCIGGINRQNVKHVREAGAPAIVAVSDILKEKNISAAVQPFITNC